MIGETDMSPDLQSHAVRAALEALDVHEATDYKEVAFFIKKVSKFCTFPKAPENVCHIQLNLDSTHKIRSETHSIFFFSFAGKD